VRDHDRSKELALDLTEHLAEHGGAEKIGRRDAMDASRAWVTARVDKGGPFGDGGAVGRTADHGDLDDTVIAGSKAGCFNIDDGEWSRFKLRTSTGELDGSDPAEPRWICRLGSTRTDPRSADSRSAGLAIAGLSRSVGGLAGLVHITTLGRTL
jgi:hypothetical protein